MSDKTPDEVLQEKVERSSRAVVEISTREYEVTDQTIAALVANGEFFAFGDVLSHLTRLEEDEIDAQGAARVKGAPKIVTTAPAFLRDRVTAAVDLKSWRNDKKAEGGKKLVSAHPPDWLPKSIIARGKWPGMPSLVGVTEVPVMRDDGSIVEEPGYDEVTGLYYAPSVIVPTIPNDPTQEDAAAALKILADVVCNFPFEGEAHKMGWVASVLTLLSRRAINDCVPMFLFNGNVRGCGKSKLADAASIIATGRVLARMSPAEHDAEERKRISSMIAAGDTIGLIDNVRGSFGSPALEVLITGKTWKDRVLGVNEKYIERPNNLQLFATGNNVILVGDMIRRVQHSRLVSPMERPEERPASEFTHYPLLPYVQEERGALLCAALTVLRAHAVAGRPKADLAAWGSFERWTDIVRQAIVFAGGADPGETRAGLRVDADTEGEFATTLFAELEKLRVFTTAVLMQAITDRKPEHAELTNAVTGLVGLATNDNRPLTNERVGKLLQRYKDVVVDGLRLHRPGTKTWQVSALTSRAQMAG